MVESVNLQEAAIHNALTYIHMAPLNEFILVKETQHWSILCFKFVELMDVENINIVQQEIKFPLFNLFLLKSLSVLSAYLFFIPTCEVIVNPYFAKLILPSVKHFTQFNNTKMTFQDNKITVYNSDDGACLITQMNLKRVIKSIMVRRSEKNISEEHDV